MAGGRFVGFVPIEVEHDHMVEYPRVMIHVWGTDRFRADSVNVVHHHRLTICP